MFAKGFIYHQRRGWLLRVFALAERTILYRERDFYRGDYAL